MNRYDEFISSHASVCEHNTHYFAHYHRHLLSIVELTLNEADLYLRNRKHFPEFNKEEYGPLFERAFDRYAEIIAGCKK